MTKTMVFPSNEYQEQVTVIQFCEFKKIPIFAIPNGGYRNPIEAKKLVASGVKAGIPDLFLPIMRNGFGGLFIEMKYGKNRTSPSQDRWIAILKENGYQVKVCYGSGEAIKEIEDYVRQKVWKSSCD